MSISIGIDWRPGQWRVCRVEQGQVAAVDRYEAGEEMLEAVRQLCARYPEPTIIVALDGVTPFGALSALDDNQLARLLRRYQPVQAFLNELSAVLRTLRSLSSQSYCAPSVEYLPTVPRHRVLMRPALGGASKVCAVVALLHFMRDQQAAWEEMNFFCLNADEQGSSLLVVVNGQIVNGLDLLQGSSPQAAASYLAHLGSEQGSAENAQEEPTFLSAALDEAFWEGLSQELAGLLAIHHLEDLVVRGSQSGKLVERLAETYQVYLFPQASAEGEGYESALGAALLGAGLETSGSAGDVVERLQLRQARRAPFAPSI